jgi:sulfate transport system permease protein
MAIRAVSVVSGHIRGETNTLPCNVEVCTTNTGFTAAFACASLLAGLSKVTLDREDGGESSSPRQTARGGGT